MHIYTGGPDISLRHPALTRQWDHAANAHLGNIVIKPYNNRKVCWTCDQCPDGHMHSWSAAVHNRSDGNGCPHCRGRKVCKHNSLTTKAPWLVGQWDYKANENRPDSVLSQTVLSLSAGSVMPVVTSGNAQFAGQQNEKWLLSMHRNQHDQEDQAPNLCRQPGPSAGRVGSQAQCSPE